MKIKGNRAFGVPGTEGTAQDMVVITCLPHYTIPRSAMDIVIYVDSAPLVLHGGRALQGRRTERQSEQPFSGDLVLWVTGLQNYEMALNMTSSFPKRSEGLFNEVDLFFIQ